MTEKAIKYLSDIEKNPAPMLLEQLNDEINQLLKDEKEGRLTRAEDLRLKIEISETVENTIYLSSEQKELLVMSEKDIEDGNIISEDESDEI